MCRTPEEVRSSVPQQGTGEYHLRCCHSKLIPRSNTFPQKKNCSKAKVTFHFLPPTTTHHQILWVGVSTNSDSRRISSPHPLSCIKGWILGRRERKGKEDIYENERKRHRETMGSSHGAHTSRNTIKRYRLTVSGRGTCT